MPFTRIRFSLLENVPVHRIACFSKRMKRSSQPYGKIFKFHLELNQNREERFCKESTIGMHARSVYSAIQINIMKLNSIGLFSGFGLTKSFSIKLCRHFFYYRPMDFRNSLTCHLNACAFIYQDNGYFDKIFPPNFDSLSEFCWFSLFFFSFLFLEKQKPPLCS